MPISGAGNPLNVVRAIEYGNEIGCRTIGLTGRDGGKLGAAAQPELNVNERHMGRIEDAHLVISHVIGYYFMHQI